MSNVNVDVQAVTKAINVYLSHKIVYFQNAPEGKSHDEKKNLVGKAKTFDDNSEAKSLVHAIQNNHLHIEKVIMVVFTIFTIL